MSTAAPSYVLSMSPVPGCRKINESKKAYLRALSLGNVNHSYILTKLAEVQILV